MDGSRFDQLIKSMGTTRITRLTALRGLALGALAATIRFAAPDDADAKCKNCGECRTKKKTKSNRGKRQCKCKAKANGTLCSNGTCQSGTCTRSVTQPPPGGFNCNSAGCVGANGGLVCDTTTGACVNCSSYTQCPTVSIQGANVQQACVSGFCLGGEPCTSTPECFGALECFNPSFDTATTEFCLFDNGCKNDGDCSGSEVCVLGYCTVTCNPGGNCGSGFSCQGGVCLFTPA
jgi:hypothetical protein